MSNTRQEQELLDFDGIAKTIVDDIKKITPEEFEPIFNKVKGDYQGSNYGYIYWTLTRIPHYFSRTRHTELNESAVTIEKLIKNNNTDSAETKNPKSIIEVIAALLQSGNWGDTSVNTNLVRGLLARLPEYSNLTLSLKEFDSLQNPLKNELKILLEKMIDENKKSFGEIIMNELKIKEEIAEDLITTRLNIFRKAGEIFYNETEINKLEENQKFELNESSIIESEKLEKHKEELEDLKLQLEVLKEEKLKREEEFAKKIQELIDEKKKHTEEFESAKKAMMLLIPETDLKNFGLEENIDLANELKQVAEEAIKMHLFNKKSIADRENELRQQPKLTNKISQLENKIASQNVEKNTIQLQKIDKIRNECANVNKDMDSIKTKLNHFLLSTMPTQKIAPKIQVVIKTKPAPDEKSDEKRKDFFSELKDKIKLRKLDSSESELKVSVKNTP